MSFLKVQNTLKNHWWKMEGVIRRSFSPQIFFKFLFRFWVWDFFENFTNSFATCERPSFERISAFSFCRSDCLQTLVILLILHGHQITKVWGTDLQQKKNLKYLVDLLTKVDPNRKEHQIWRAWIEDSSNLVANSTLVDFFFANRQDISKKMKSLRTLWGPWPSPRES